MNVVAMVTYNRPWLLKINLEILLSQPTVNQYDYIFSTDYGYDPEIPKIVNWFAQESKTSVLFNINSTRESSLPAFDNIMRLYRKAADHATDYVLIMEEDIIPTLDYLRFNNEVYNNFLVKYDRIFCLCHKRRPETELIGKHDILIGDYQLTSPSCISKKNIHKYINPELLHPAFFKNQALYNTLVHPMHRNNPNHHIHHDGQLERIADLHKLFSLKPDQARSMHVGIGGINCSGKLTGTFDELYNKFKTLIINNDGETLRSYEPTFKRDMCIAPLNTKWTDLKLDIDRTLSTASSWSFDPFNEFSKYIKETN